MQLKSEEYQLVEPLEIFLSDRSDDANSNDLVIVSQHTLEPEPPVAKDMTAENVTQFRTHFIGSMELYGDSETVAKYLDAHAEWFRRCAHPMKVEPIGANGYALVIGRFGAFGYEVEPKVGLDLLPAQAGVYRIETIPVPNYTPPGYEVDFQSEMRLVEQSSEQAGAITHVKWHLDLIVHIQFPKFIHTLPASMIQKTGDQLLYQIVRQVSKRLSHKVQEDFHASIGATLPKSKQKWFGSAN